MKKFINKYKYIDLIVVGLILTIIIVSPFFDSEIFRGQDLQYHLSRLDGIISAIKDRQIPLAIYPYKNFGYGYAAPLFYSDYLLVLPAIIGYVFNIPLVLNFKLIVFVFVSIGVISSLICTYKMFNNKLSSIIATIIFAFCNYYITDIFVRSALGEIMAISFFSMLIYSIYKFIYEEKSNYISLGILFALIAHSHIISFAFACILFGILIIINHKKLLNKKTVLTLFKAIVVGIGLSSVFIFPMIEQYISQDLNVHHTIYALKDNLVTIENLFSDFASQFNFKYSVFDLDNSYTNSQGIVNVDSIKSFGLLVLISPFAYILIKNKNKFINNIFFIFIIVILISIGVIPIHKIEIFDFIQFSSRFYIVGMALSLYIVTYSLTELSDRVNYVILILVMLFNIYNISYLYSTLIDNRLTVKIPNDATANELFIERIYAKPGSLGSRWNREELMNGEYLPNTYDYSYLDKNNIIMWVNYEPAIYDYYRKGTAISFHTNFNYDDYLVLPITWYKGYVCNEFDINNEFIKQIPIEVERYSRTVMIKMEKGYHRYEVKYKGTKIQKMSFIISIGSVFVICYLSIKRKFK